VLLLFCCSGCCVAAAAAAVFVDVLAGRVKPFQVRCMRGWCCSFWFLLSLLLLRCRCVVVAAVAANVLAAAVLLFLLFLLPSSCFFSNSLTCQTGNCFGVTSVRESHMWRRLCVRGCVVQLSLKQKQAAAAGDVSPQPLSCHCTVYWQRAFWIVVAVIVAVAVSVCCHSSCHSKSQIVQGLAFRVTPRCTVGT